LDSNADGADNTGGTITLFPPAMMYHRLAQMMNLPGLYGSLLQRASCRLLQNQNHLVNGIHVIVIDNDEEPISLKGIERILVAARQNRGRALRRGGDAVKPHLHYSRLLPLSSHSSSIFKVHEYAIPERLS